MSPSSGFWIETDERDDVAGSLRHALVCLELVRSDHCAWKWLILSFHSALQGACVCHLTTTAQPFGALTPANTKEWLEYFDCSRDDPETPMPPTRIASLPVLLKRVRRSNTIGSGHSFDGIRITDGELGNLCHLHDEVRNQFVHFEPKGWSLEVTGMEIQIPLIVRIISDIDAAGWAFRHEDSEQMAAMRESIDQITIAAGHLFENIARE